MKFIQHRSSSSSNLYEVVAGNGRRLLLECGLPWAKLQKVLGYDLSNIDGVLITHEHMDHSWAAEEVMKAGIDIYSSQGTLEATGLVCKRRAISIIEPIFNIGTTFGVLAFGVNHDADNPMGYLVHEHGTEEYLLFCPDSSHLKQRFFYRFTIVALGCNYDRDILRKRVKAGKIHEEVAKRIVENHASKESTFKYLTGYDKKSGEKFCDISRCREIHLLHCSAGNLDKEKTKAEFKARLFIEPIIKGV
jgi:phosphoribosyl 1,2-cyclic phosphodiesterase